MNTRDAASRWAEVWARCWPAQDVDGLVVEARDYSHVKQGHFPPPTDLFG